MFPIMVDDQEYFHPVDYIETTINEKYSEFVKKRVNMTK